MIVSLWSTPTFSLKISTLDRNYIMYEEIEHNTIFTCNTIAHSHMGHPVHERK